MVDTLTEVLGACLSRLVTVCGPRWWKPAFESHRGRTQFMVKLCGDVHPSWCDSRTLGRVVPDDVEKEKEQEPRKG